MIRHAGWAVPTVIGALLATRQMGGPSLWLDEGITAALTAAPAPIFWHAALFEDPGMLLYMIALRGWRWLGDSEAVLRALSALCATLAIPLWWWIGRHLFDRWTATVIALLLATNPFFLRYAQEARAYAMLVLTTSIALACLVRALERATIRRWVAWGLTMGLATWTHVIGVMTFGAQACGAVAVVATRRRTGIRPLAVGTAIAATLTAAMVILVRRSDLEQLRWLSPPPFASIAWLYAGYIGTGGPIALALALAAIALAIVAALTWRPEIRDGVVIVGAAAVLPVVATFVVSRWLPLFLDRYLIATLPPLLALMAAGAMAPPWPWLRVLCALLLIGGSLRGYPFPRIPNEDWRSATAWIAARAAPDDALLPIVGHGRYPTEYYLRHAGTAITVLKLGPLPDSLYQWWGIPTAQTIDTIATRHPRVWVVLTHLDVGQKPRRQALSQAEAVLATHYLRGEEHAVPGVRVVEWRWSR